MNAPLFWHNPSFAGLILSPLSLLYWWLARLRASRFEEAVMPVPVICVGNNTVGGSGKTPLVIALCDRLIKRGRKPHVISRGYKGSYAGTLRVDAATHTAREVGDEPLLMAAHVPCWVSRSRVDAALAAIEAGADCILMDDGMQNPTLKKHLTLMVVDGTYGFGNRQMLPAGPCREPIAESLSKAQLLVIMGQALHPDVVSVAKLHPQVLHAFMVSSAADAFSGLTCYAFSGIGRPEKFFAMLRDCGAQVIESVAFPDHHFFSETELEQLSQKAASQQAVLVTTQKDWMRLSDAWRARVRTLDVSVCIEEEALLEAALDAVLEGRPA